MSNSWKLENPGKVLNMQSTAVVHRVTRIRRFRRTFSTKPEFSKSLPSWIQNFSLSQPHSFVSKVCSPAVTCKARVSFYFTNFYFCLYVAVHALLVETYPYSSASSLLHNRPLTCWPSSTPATIYAKFEN